MPGQRKRKRSRERERARANRRTAVPGHWETLFSTEDHAELKEYVRRLHAEGTVTDPDLLRIDMLCGRLVVPTTHRVSLFVPDAPDAQESSA